MKKQPENESNEQNESNEKEMICALLWQIGNSFKQLGTALGDEDEDKRNAEIKKIETEMDKLKKLTK